MKERTRKQFREETASNIAMCADFGSDGCIQASVELVREAIKDGNMEEVEKWLKNIEEYAIHIHSTNIRNYHAMEMMRHFALAIGEKYDPML